MIKSFFDDQLSQSELGKTYSEVHLERAELFTMGLLPTLTRSRVRTHVARLCLGICIRKRVCIRAPRPRPHHRNTSSSKPQSMYRRQRYGQDFETAKHEQKIIKSTKLNPILPHVHLAMWIQQEIQPHVMPVYSDSSNGQTNSFQVARHEVAMINLKQPSDYQILNPDVFVYYTASPPFFLASSDCRPQRP